MIVYIATCCATAGRTAVSVDQLLMCAVHVRHLILETSVFAVQYRAETTNQLQHLPTVVVWTPSGGARMICVYADYI